MKNIEWLLGLKQKVPRFLEKLKGGKVPGFFHYSLSGDLYGEDIKWGLGNTVFAVKIYYTLGLLETLPQNQKREMAGFIKSFQSKDGTIYDPLIRRKAFLREKVLAIKNLNLSNFFHQQTVRAETRQAISALKLLNENPDILYNDFPKTEKEVYCYLSNLEWQKPWDAGSHFSHLIFFLKNSTTKEKDSLIEFAIEWVNRLQNIKDGAWYRGNPNLQQKINGAMKVITGLKVAEKINFQYSHKLIDLCLSAKNDSSACDNFNIVYVLHYANRISGGTHRGREIKKFAEERLEIYKKHYYPEIGGFSFLPGKANTHYYEAKITKGLNEPDIHGTCMFLWGISIIGQILKISEKLKLKELAP